MNQNETKNTVIVLKAEVTKVLNKIYQDDTHNLRPLLVSVMNKEYLASKRFSDKLIAELLCLKTDQGGLLLNIIGEAVINDKDTIRRYTHEWRKKKMAQIEAEKAQQNQVVNTQVQ